MKPDSVIVFLYSAQNIINNIKIRPSSADTSSLEQSKSVHQRVHEHKVHDIFFILVLQSFDPLKHTTNP